MNKILIISDTHFLSKKDLHNFFQRFDDVCAIIHCGDIYITYEPNDFTNLYICKGNNDFAKIPQINHFTIKGLRFTITHGHLQHLASNPLSLKSLLNDYPADYICFGHTHVPYFHQDDDCTLINPGSLVLARNYPRINTYVLLDIPTKTCRFYNFKNHQEIKREKD